MIQGNWLRKTAMWQKKRFQPTKGALLSSTTITARYVRHWILYSYWFSYFAKNCHKCTKENFSPRSSAVLKWGLKKENKKVPSTIWRQSKCIDSNSTFSASCLNSFALLNGTPQNFPKQFTQAVFDCGRMICLIRAFLVLTFVFISRVTW